MTDNVKSIFDLLDNTVDEESTPASAVVADSATTAPAVESTEAEAEITENAVSNEIKPAEAEEAVESAEKADEKASSDDAQPTEAAPVADPPVKAEEPAANTDDVPELSIERTPKPDKKAEKPVEAKDIKVDGVDLSSFEDLYAKLLASEDYMPIVKGIDKMTDEELDDAVRAKLCEDLTPEIFVFIWLLNGGSKVPREYKERFMIKSKRVPKGIDYLVKNIRKHISASSPSVHHSKIKTIFGEYLNQDDAKIAAEEAKKEAERKAKAAEKAKAAKEKSKKSKTSDKSKTATAKEADKATGAKQDKASTKKAPAAAKKSSAPRAATNESIMSLFDMM